MTDQSGIFSESPRAVRPSINIYVDLRIGRQDSFDEQVARQVVRDRRETGGRRNG